MLRVLGWLLAGELGLGLVALVWAWESETPLRYALSFGDLLLGLGLSVVFTAINFALFRAARAWSFMKPSVAFFEEEIFPLVRKASGLEILLVALAAGFAEELLFRGLLLPRMGIAASSLLFGFLHGPDVRLWPFAVWASLAGLGFAIVYRETGNLAVPMLVHAAYDALALAYIRWTRPSGGSL